MKYLIILLAAASQLGAAAVGQSATLSVTADGTKPFNYQWYKDGAPILLGTKATYTIPVLSLSDSGVYYAAVWNGATNGTRASDYATLVVTPATGTPPSISYFSHDNAWASQANPANIYWSCSNATTVTLTDPNGVAQTVPSTGNVVITTGADGYVWTLKATSSSGVSITQVDGCHGAFSAAVPPPPPTRKQLEQQAAIVVGVSFDSVNDVFGAPGGLTAAQVHALRDALDVLGVNN